MDYFPIFLDLAGQRVVVVGGGEIAARKIGLLQSAGALVNVIAPELNEALTERLAAARISHTAKVFEPADLAGARLCIAATNRRDVNAAAAAAAKAIGIPVNVVDDPELCGFIMPSIVDRGRIVVAISSGGVSPVLARLIRARLELALPHTIAALADLAAAWRDRVRAALPDPGRRRRFWEDLFENAPNDVQELEKLDLTSLIEQPPPARTDIIGVPEGDPELLTIRDLRRIRAADLILYDPSLPRTVLDQARRDADIIAASPGPQSLERAEAATSRGQRVVVLVYRR